MAEFDDDDEACENDDASSSGASDWFDALLLIEESDDVLDDETVSATEAAADEGHTPFPFMEAPPLSSLVLTSACDGAPLIPLPTTWFQARSEKGKEKIEAVADDERVVDTEAPSLSQKDEEKHQCSGCARLLPASEFSNWPRRKRCKSCQNASQRNRYHQDLDKTRADRRDYRQRNPDIFRQAGQRYYNKHKDRALLLDRTRYWKNTWNLSLDEVSAILCAYDNKCEICKTSKDQCIRQRLFFDHNHANGLFRGILCFLCNRGVGALGDDADRFRRAILYLERPPPDIPQLERVVFVDEDHERDRRLKHEYGINLRQFEWLVAQAHGICPICQKTEEMCVDHNHDTEKIRGVLCRLCNTGIGQFKDDVSRLQVAIKYLEKQ
jgi:hypothetical protein